MDTYFIAYKNGIERRKGTIADITDYKNLLTDWFVNHTDMPAPLMGSYRVYWEELLALYRHVSSIAASDGRELGLYKCVMRAIAFIIDNFGTLYDKNNTEFYIEVKNK